ncbi:hypothetical protein RclHR1_00590011 [Rhizophagus clarus]|uniref:Uncharacterized protein n=1 Tax=Rhizophagus clarus TaxID=94130 RepID=A0A2Z6S1Y1_9GLOM|nr:hypothetical protein RclHR1_00590011 [Rhizophagus clarus]
MTCTISKEPTDQLCVLGCQHSVSLYNLEKLKQKLCPECQEKIEYDIIRNLPQNSTYKNLYSEFTKSGHILPSIELEVSNDSDISDNSKVILIKKKKKRIQLIN